MFYILILLFFPVNAYAYLDPGALTMIIQLIVGGIVAGIVMIKVYWDNFCQYIKTLFNKNAQNVTESDTGVSEEDDSI